MGGQIPGRRPRWPQATRRASLMAAAVAVASAVPTVLPGRASGAPLPHRTLLVLGDSWAAGLHADPAHALGQVAARSLGWRGRVDAVSGSGYLNTASQAADYVRRAAAVPRIQNGLAVVQGGSNDGSQDLDRLTDAVRSTIGALRSRLGDVPILLLGPGPDPEPVTPLQRQVDDLIAIAAADLGVPYASMLRQGWITPATASAVIDSGTAHPTAAGQRYLGHRLADEVRLRFPALTGAAVPAVDWEGPTAHG